MFAINIILLFVALIGFLPLIIILYKKARVKKIMTTGSKARATVYDVRRIHRTAEEIVCYCFYAQNSEKQYTGSLSIKAGIYKTGDT